MIRGTLTPKNIDSDPDDVRRVREIEDLFQSKSLDKYETTPDVKLLHDVQLCLIDDGTTVSLALRNGDTMYKIDLTAI